MKALNADTIVVFHQQGAPEHYKGLEFLAQEAHYKIDYREFTLIRQAGSAIKNINVKKFFRVFTNLYAMASLLTTKNKVIILGIAPYDFHMIYFEALSRRHKIFFHTSWPYWDQTRYPMKSSVTFIDKKAKTSWQNFLERSCHGIFSVSGAALSSLMANYKISCPSEIVLHSIGKSFNNKRPETTGNKLRCLYVGRLIDSKGIPEILQLLDKYDADIFELGIAGDGVLKSTVESAVSNHQHLTYYGRVANNKLADIYHLYDVFLLPSKKTSSGDWEELFGISLIEAMACGLIPIASDHIGPKEIITPGKTGFLISDSSLFTDLTQALDCIAGLSAEKKAIIRQACIQSSEKYREECIAQRWNNVLSLPINSN